MHSKNIDRIQKQEAILNSVDFALNELEAVLQNLETLLPHFKELMKYYGGEDWFDDMEASEKSDFPNIPRGVLSQDAVYNLFQIQRELQFKNIRLALDYLE